MSMVYKRIKEIDEITEEDILNNTRFTTDGRGGKYFSVDKDTEGYCICGDVCGHMTTSVTQGTYVKYWKTLSGVKRAIKNFAIKGQWGFRQWFSTM